ncbi:MAG TPA: lysylphosphatidylglycerol synthase transmembrane domain-containing protein [Ardenticatenaceae bacterium]|nr:lysylphosphatidylglycerol synthase transmembrane domain-containing protein [Ardenticatenaceae bacterium]
MDTRARLFLGTAISLILLVVVFRNTNWSEMLAALRGANYTLLALATLVTIGGVILRAFRWRALFWPETRLSLGALFDAVNVGYLANNLLPARAGDVLRAYLAGEWARVGVAHALSTTVVERVIDVLFVVAMLFSLLPFLPLPRPLVEAALLVGAAFILASAVLVGLSLQRERGRRILARILGLVPRLDADLWSERLIALLDGFAILRAPGPLARVLAWSAIVWLEGIAVHVLTIRAFGLTSLPLATGVLTLCAAALGMAVPSAPSAAGTFHAAAYAVLLAFQVSDDRARAVAVALHAFNFVPLTILGFWSLARRGLSYRQLAGRASRVAGQQPATEGAAPVQVATKEY